MKAKDFISKRIQEQAIMYKCDDYDRSRLKVLSNTLFSSSVYDIAVTGDPATGGYVVTPVYDTDKYGFRAARLLDKPYGEETYKPLPDRYFESDVYYVLSPSEPLDVVTDENTGMVYYRFDPPGVDDIVTPVLKLIVNGGQFVPGKIIRGFSLFSHIVDGNMFLQDDWKEEVKFLCVETRRYLHDENRYKDDPLYPTDNRISYEINLMEYSFKMGGSDSVRQMRVIHKYEPGETVPTWDEVAKRLMVSWNEYREFAISYIDKFLSRK